jgi:4-carboxymuconolactone decarboxylase
MDKQLYDAGLASRKTVLGAEYVDKSIQGADDFNRDFQRIVTEYCWGEVWAKGKALSDKQRSMNNLCMLAALNRPHEFELHFNGALNNGCTLDELREVLTQITIYCGVPAGVEAFRIARKVLAERKKT